MEKVGRSISGKPVITESGGGYTNTGTAQIITGAAGERIKPIFTPRRGRANGEHATFVAFPGQHVIRANRWRDGEYVIVYRIDKIGTDKDQDEMILSIVGEYKDGDTTIPEAFNEAVSAALEKVSCYHCRRAHYIKK